MATNVCVIVVAQRRELMAISNSARLFLERAGLRPTYRRPCSTVIPGDNPIHSYPVDRPTVSLTDMVDGYPPPDRSRTTNDPWPFGLT